MQVRGSQSKLPLQDVLQAVDRVVDQVVLRVILRVVLEVSTRLGSASHVAWTQTSRTKLSGTAVFAMMS